MTTMRAYLTFSAAVMVAVFTFTAAAAEQVSLRTLLPSDDCISGWPVISGSERAAIDESQLRDLFGDAAAEHISHGVTSARQRSYQRDNVVLVVRIHRHGSRQQARSFFELLSKRIEGSTGYMSTGSIKEHYAQGSTGGETVAHIWQERYSCTITVAGDSVSERATAMAFARCVSQNIAEAHR